MPDRLIYNRYAISTEAIYYYVMVHPTSYWKIRHCHVTRVQKICIKLDIIMRK